MNKNIAILRGINVGGHRKILMADLKVLFEKLGCKNVQTYIQSGNVIFNSSENELESKISLAIKKQYGYDVPVIIRSLEELEAGVAANPFLKDKTISIDRLHLTFLSEVPTKESLEKLQNIDLSPDQIEVIGKDVFGCVLDRFSDSKLTINLFEKTLNVSATTRNWKTVSNLLELAREQ
jgi:uncharacterized protein (DUF1697 family)